MKYLQILTILEATILFYKFQVLGIIQAQNAIKHEALFIYIII